MNTRWIHFFIFVLFILSGTAICQEKKSDEDAKRIQGTWRIVSIDFSGEAPAGSAEEVKKFIEKGRVKITATELIFSMEGEKDEKSQYRLYPNRPGVMDRFADVPIRKKIDRQHWPAIYELKEDMLKICGYTSPVTADRVGSPEDLPAALEAARPKAFKSAEKHMLMVLKRVK